MSNDTSKLSASLEKGSVEVSGPHAEKLSGAVLDLLSPFTESAGWIGDMVRVRRESAVLRALEEAHRQAHDQGLVIPKKSPRIIEHWVKGASEADNEEISKKWGRLLLAETPNTASMLFGDFLRKIGGDEARWLDDLWSRFDTGARLHNLHAERTRNIRHETRARMFGADNEMELEPRCHDLHSELGKIGLIVRAIEYEAFDFDDPDDRELQRHLHTWEPNLIHPDIFAAIGILALEKFSVNAPKREESVVPEVINLQCYTFTRVGAEFLRATNSA